MYFLYNGSKVVNTVQKRNIAPSLICTDLCNIRAEVKALEEIGCTMLHVDVMDGIFSPDMPLGIGTVKALRDICGMTLDVHLMSVNNPPYVDLLLQCGIDRLCFHPETEARPSILLRKIRAAGVRAGLAISPEIGIGSIEYLLPLCDFVLLMRIDAGYAHLDGQCIYPQTEEKIRLLQAYAKKYGLDPEIEADGRIGFAETEALAQLGVHTFVSGTKGIFSPDGTREENLRRLQNILQKAEEKYNV